MRSTQLALKTSSRLQIWTSSVFPIHVLSPRVYFFIFCSTVLLIHGHSFKVLSFRALHGRSVHPIPFVTKRREMDFSSL